MPRPLVPANLAEVGADGYSVECFSEKAKTGARGFDAEKTRPHHNLSIFWIKEYVLIGCV